MARYTGPACRLCRRIGEKLMLKGERCLGAKCAMERRNMPPGQQGFRRRKVSERGAQLKEKQKVRYIYGVLEGQFRRHFAEAGRRPGVTGLNLLQLLEMRLDNVVYRLGFADSRRQARQLVSHGHIALNGRRTDIPSCALKLGDTVQVLEDSLALPYFRDMVEHLAEKWVPNWLSREPGLAMGRVISIPARTDIEGRINEQVVVEFYSR